MPETLSQKRARAAHSRKVHSGGRKPRHPDRCPCGEQARSRALKRWPARGGRCPGCDQNAIKVPGDVESAT